MLPAESETWNVVATNCVPEGAVTWRVSPASMTHAVPGVRPSPVVAPDCTMTEPLKEQGGGKITAAPKLPLGQGEFCTARTR